MKRNVPIQSGPLARVKAIVNWKSQLATSNFSGYVHTAMSKRSVTIPDEAVIRRIHVIRGQKVMLDRDLAELYGVETRRLNEQVRRNIDRFPEDFMFEMTGEELADRSRNLRHPIGR